MHSLDASDVSALMKLAGSVVLWFWKEGISEGRQTGEWMTCLAIKTDLTALDPDTYVSRTVIQWIYECTERASLMLSLYRELSVEIYTGYLQPVVA